MSDVFDMGRYMLTLTLAGPTNLGPAPPPALSHSVVTLELNKISERVTDYVSKGEDHYGGAASLREEIRKLGDEVREYTQLDRGPGQLEAAIPPQICF